MFAEGQSRVKSPAKKFKVLQPPRELYFHQQTCFRYLNNEILVAELLFLAHLRSVHDYLRHHNFSFEKMFRLVNFRKKSNAWRQSNNELERNITAIVRHGGLFSTRSLFHCFWSSCEEWSVAIDCQSGRKNW